MFCGLPLCRSGVGGTDQAAVISSSDMKRLFLAGILSAALLLAADITGTWSAQVETDMGSGTPTFTFKQSGDQLSGTYKGNFGEQKLTGTVKDNDVEFSFTIDAGGQTAKAAYKGKIDGASMSGSVVFGDLAKGTWKAKKS